MYPRTFLQHSILQHNIPKLGTESSPARPQLMCPRAANIQDIQASLRFDSVEGSFLWFKGQKQQLRQRQKVSRISNLHNLAEGLGGDRGLVYVYVVQERSKGRSPKDWSDAKWKQTEGLSLCIRKLLEHHAATIKRWIIFLVLFKPIAHFAHLELCKEQWAKSNHNRSCGRI